MLPKDIIWKPCAGIGFEHLKISEEKHQILVDSLVVGSLHDKQIMRIKYEIVLDHAWVTREVKIGYLGENQTLRLSSDGKGTWKDEHGQVIPELSGAVDIDISCTPFTNTLPIKRLSYEPLQPQEIDVVYISAVDLNWKRVKQKYTLLERGDDSSLYRYQSGNFQESITVDSNGIVLHYPNLFDRETL
jgi:uncharacterized protein